MITSYCILLYFFTKTLITTFEIHVPKCPRFTLKEKRKKNDYNILLRLYLKYLCEILSKLYFLTGKVILYRIHESLALWIGFINNILYHTI